MKIEINTNEPLKKTWAQPKLYDSLNVNDTSALPEGVYNDGEGGTSVNLS